MGTATKRTLAFVLVLAATAAAQEVHSANGKFLARVRPPGEVEVEGGWSAHDLALAPAESWLLTDDGRTLVAIAAQAAIPRPIVQVVREGKLIARADAEALGLAQGGLNRGSAPVRLRSVEREGKEEFALDLLGRDGLVRRVDLATGAIRLPATPAPTRRIGPPRVETAAPEGGEPVFLGEWFAPEAVLAGQPLPVHVRGSMPTPAWRFSGFELKTLGDASSLQLLPRAIAPPPGAISIQVLKSFDETASVFGLEPGAYRIGVSGRATSEAKAGQELRPVRVLPAGTLAFLERTGGIAGGFLRVVLLEDGRVEVARDRGASPELFLASDAERAAAARALARLPAAPARRPPSAGADLLHDELAWITDGHPLRAVRDDASLEPELRALAESLAALAPAPVSGARFAIDPFKSIVEVRTESSGLLSAFGHEHRLTVRTLDGSIEADPADLAHGSLVLRIEAGSLAVVDDESQKDRPAIEKEMNEHVLEVARFPAIEFKSRGVEVKSMNGEVGTVEITGDLALHGQTRPIRVPARIEIHGESVHATGKLKLKQTDFGIAPTSAVAGTVKVADEVVISFDVVATRAGSAPR
jgi:polyisoprenoid-binding protein YceI